MKIKLFYSYSHKDEDDREELEKHLVTLKNLGLDEWHDRKIKAGDDWQQEIDREMESSHIILLLFSADFIASNPCQREVEKALDLKNNGAIFIPIILKECAWKDIDEIANIQVLPKNATPVNKWNDMNDAWCSIHEAIKRVILEIKDGITPKLKDDFRKSLLKNPITDATLDELFVYPDILEVNKSKQLEKNEVDSEKLKDITSFAYKYVLIEGDEQSGKTSLCRMLYLYHASHNFYPILLEGGDITGRANMENIVNEKYKKQYESSQEYFSLPKEKRILIIDDINNRSANNKNYSAFLQLIRECFEYSIVLIDKLSNLSIQ